MGHTIPLLLALILSSVATASAQDSVPIDRDLEARALFDAGQIAFDQGRYANALDDFERSYELSPHPDLLYNIGSSADRLRQDARALEAFRRFIELAPDSPQAPSVQARIAILEAALSREEPQDTAESDTVESDTVESDTMESDTMESDAVANSSIERPTPKGDEPRDIAGPLALVIGGGVALVAGAILLGLAANDVAAVEGSSFMTRWSSVSDAYHRSEPLSIAGAVTLAVGAAVTTGGLIWWLVPAQSSSERVWVVPTPAGVLLRGRF